MSKHPRAFLLSLGVVAAFSAASGSEKNRFNLAEKPEKPRFTLADISWPKEVGQAEICLWKDDKVAALSLGVDDNFAGEIDFWKETAKKHDFKVTWFVITGRITEGGRSAGGTWPQFRELEELGHGVESHTVTHLHLFDQNWGTPQWNYADVNAARKTAQQGGEDIYDRSKMAADIDAIPNSPAPDWIRNGIAWEYSQSIDDIDKGIPGKKVSALAYPGGKATKFNDRETAAKYFRVARGATGAPNRADMTDYMSTNAMSNWAFGDATDKHPAGNVNNILDPQLYKGRYYRGWLVLFWHGVHANPALLERTVDFIERNREKLWIGLYADVAKYGQERDTATLTVESSTPEKITLSLTDEMDDSHFDFPLTVKVRIPNDWTTAKAEQAGKPVEAKILEHEGNAYALLQAVPDAGSITLTK
jgi:hypothetical protein